MSNRIWAVALAIFAFWSALACGASALIADIGGWLGGNANNIAGGFMHLLQGLGNGVVWLVWGVGTVVILVMTALALKAAPSDRRDSAPLRE